MRRPNALSRQQRLVNAWARFAQRPALQHIKNVRVARVLTDLTAPMTYRRPPNMLLKPMTLTSGRAQVPATACTIKHQPMDGTVLYLHGGGFVMGSLTMYQHLVARIGAAAGMRGVFADYRLAPEHPFPAALDDAVTAYAALCADPETGPIAVVGDSAGGNLVLALLLRIKEAQLPHPCAAVAISPVVNMAFDYPSITANAQSDHLVPGDWGKRSLDLYAGDHDRTHPHLSPIYGDFTGCPPVMVHYDSEEVLADDGAKIVDHLRAQDVSVETEVTQGRTHVWHLQAGRTPEADASVADIGAFLRRHTPQAHSTA